MNPNHNKNLVRGLLVFAIVLCAYNLLAFLIPFRHTSTFWLGYVFGLVAIAFQIVALLVAFRNVDTARSKFYGIPTLRVGLYYLVGQLILSFIAMALGFVPGFPIWPLWLIFILFLAFAALGMIGADAVRDEIEQQEFVVKRDTSAMRELQNMSASLARRCQDPALAAELKKVAEDLRYSDPVSSALTEESEYRIKEMLEDVSGEVSSRQTYKALETCKSIRNLLAERNEILKQNKK